jgi:hypothetical protein
MSKQVPKTTIVKTTVSLPTDLLEHARVEAVARGTSVSDVLRRAAELARYLDAATKEGDRLLLERGDKSVRELVILR